MDFKSMRSHQWFARFAVGLLAYNILVILWGAYVRVSYSGDGCGAHWPFCSGQVVPQHMAAPMMIEFTHRMMTSVDLIGTIVLCVWAFRAFPRKHTLRFYASLSLILLFVEALLGAGLVIFRYVAKDQSAGRAWYLSAHLTNTMLLLAAFTTIAWLARGQRDHLRWANASSTLLGALLVAIVVSVTGTIAALGDTLAPASSLAGGIQQDFAATGNLLVKLRLFHPFVAVVGAVYIIWAASQELRRNNTASLRPAAASVIGVTIFQVIAGAINLSLLAPMWMQLFHLLVADAVWIALVVLVLESAALLVVEKSWVPLHGHVQNA